MVQLINDCLPALIYLWSAPTGYIAGLYVKFSFPVALGQRWCYPDGVVCCGATDGVPLVDDHGEEAIKKACCQSVGYQRKEAALSGGLPLSETGL